MRIFTAVFFIYSLLAFNTVFASEKLVSSNEQIANILEKGKNGNVIPDFSTVGYMGGGVTLPQVKTVLKLSPAPQGDDRRRIQDALDQIAQMPLDKNGFRGALLLKKGQYRINGSVYIKKSGIVLRGEGQFTGGTELIATKQDSSPFNKKHSLIYMGDPKRTYPKLGFLEKKGNKTAITDHYVPVGAKVINVKNPQQFHVDDHIIIELIPNHKWLETIQLEQVWGNELAYLYQRYERKIISIDKTAITIDTPLVNVIDKNLLKSAFAWGCTDKVRIDRCGVEYLRCISSFDKSNQDDENHAKSAVFINRAKDCWVKNITALHFSGSAVDISFGARNITVEDCAFLRPVSLIAGSRRYAFMINGSRCLVQRCYSRQARHAFVSSSKVRGPNVFLDCLSERDFAEIGPHHRWATGFLYDNIASPRGKIYVQNRMKMAKHGWTGVNIVFWNCKCSEIMCDTPPTGDENWCIGAIASKRSGWMSYPGKSFGVWFSHGSHVKPRSLYLYQMKKRLGQTAVKNITIALQRTGASDKIYKYLKNSLAELNKYEKTNDGNLLLNSSFKNMNIKHSNAADIKLDTLPGYWKLENGGIFKRIPYSQDAFALAIPSGAVLSSMVCAINYPDTARELALKFNYRIKKQNTIKVTIYYYIIKYDNSWVRVKTYNIPPVKGSMTNTQWQSYTFKFLFTPVIDEAVKMPYSSYLKIQFTSSDNKFDFANPSLKILNKK
jgi:hypothetical protein